MYKLCPFHVCAVNNNVKLVSTNHETTTSQPFTFPLHSPLMNQYQTFIFESYALDAKERTIKLNYSLDDAVHFTETIQLPEGMPLNANDPDLEPALFALHLIGGISYYKTCLPKTIEIRSGGLTSSQTAFWNDVYENGLGEFFFKNDIDFRGLIHFPATAPHFRTPSLITRDASKSPLVPIGGGKDSLVTTELLKKAGFDVTLLRIGHHPLIDEAAKTAGCPLWNVKRALAAELFDLNAQGALNGHVPITGYLYFLSVVIGLLSGKTHVAFSNEESAEEGNVEFHGKEINHQWSKSVAFERMFQTYVSTFITKNVTCFSMLRTLSELKIAEVFCTYPQYLPMATSCNKNWQILSKDAGRPRWCGTCPKCAFAFTLFSAFLPKNDLEGMFGGNLFEDETLLPLFRELLGLEGHKPFECVGTKEETAAAFIMAHNRGEHEGTAAMNMFVKECLPEITEPDEMIGAAMMQRMEHAIPTQYLSVIAHV